MVPSQDVDVDIRAGHWKISSRVQANSFSASFQVARLAGLPEGMLAWSNIIIFDDTNVLDVSPLRPPRRDALKKAV
jgi:hypothetical protein